MSVTHMQMNPPNVPHSRGIPHCSEPSFVHISCRNRLRCFLSYPLHRLTICHCGSVVGKKSITRFWFKFAVYESNYCTNVAFAPSCPFQVTSFGIPKMLSSELAFPTLFDDHPALITFRENSLYYISVKYFWKFRNNWKTFSKLTS